MKIAEVVQVRLPNGASPDAKTQVMGGVDSHHRVKEVGIKSIIIRTGIGNNHWKAVLNHQIKGEVT